MPHPQPYGYRYRTALKVVGLALGIGWLTGCSNLPFVQNSIPEDQSGTTLPSQRMGERIAPANAPASGTAGYSFAATCDTGEYVVGISWPTEEPILTFWRSPGEILLNSATAEFNANPGDVETYTVQGNPRVVATFRGDRTCSIQATDASGNTIVNQEGRTRFDNQPQPSPGPTITPSPTPTATIPPSPINPTVTPIPPGGTSIACRGNIQNRVDFTVFYVQGQGFNRIDLRPPAGNTISTTLFPSGSDAQGRPVYRGSVNAAAEITVIPQFASPPRSGDQVFVQYDGATGTGVCGGGLPALW